MKIRRISVAVLISVSAVAYADERGGESEAREAIVRAEVQRFYELVLAQERARLQAQWQAEAEQARRAAEERQRAEQKARIDAAVKEAEEQYAEQQRQFRALLEAVATAQRRENGMRMMEMGAGILSAQRPPAYSPPVNCSTLGRVTTCQ